MSVLNWDDAGVFLHRDLQYIMTFLWVKWGFFFHSPTPHSFPLLCLQEPKKSVPSSCARLRGILVVPVFTVELLLQHRGSLNVSEIMKSAIFLSLGLLLAQGGGVPIQENSVTLGKRGENSIYPVFQQLLTIF